MEITRVELYDLVWDKPITHLAKEFGLSDVGLRKICIKYGIPLPARGYWARLQHGKQDPKAMLEFENHNPNIHLPDEGTVATREQMSLMQKLAKRAEREVVPVLRDPQQFKDIRCIKTYQAILARVKELELRTGQSYKEYKAGQRSFPPKKVFDLAMFVSGQEQIQMSATIDNALRAVAIADIVIERLAERGIDVVLAPIHNSNSSEMRAVKDGQYFEFRFWEPSTKATRTNALTVLERSFNNYSYGYDTIMLPRNILSVLYGGSYVSSTVQDKVSVKLEHQIERIVEKIEQKLDQKARAHLEHLAWEREYERKKAIREHNERVIEDREQQLERAIADSLDYEKAQQLKRYLKQLSLAIDRLPEEQRAYGLAWLRMVREQRKGLNPIAERLESFRILASEQAGDSEEYWGLELIGEEHDPEFDEALEDERLTFGW